MMQKFEMKAFHLPDAHALFDPDGFFQVLVVEAGTVRSYDGHYLVNAVHVHDLPDASVPIIIFNALRSRRVHLYDKYVPEIVPWLRTLLSGEDVARHLDQMDAVARIVAEFPYLTESTDDNSVRCVAVPGFQYFSGQCAPEVAEELDVMFSAFQFPRGARGIQTTYTCDSEANSSDEFKSHLLSLSLRGEKLPWLLTQIVYAGEFLNRNYARFVFHPSTHPAFGNHFFLGRVAYKGVVQLQVQTDGWFSVVRGELCYVGNLFHYEVRKRVVKHAQTHTALVSSTTFRVRDGIAALAAFCKDVPDLQQYMTWIRQLRAVLANYTVTPTYSEFVDLRTRRIVRANPDQPFSNPHIVLTEAHVDIVAHRPMLNLAPYVRECSTISSQRVWYVSHSCFHDMQTHHIRLPSVLSLVMMVSMSNACTPSMLDVITANLEYM